MFSALLDTFERIFRRETTSQELLSARIAADVEVAQENARRWHAGLPTQVVTTLIVAVAALTLLLNYAATDKRSCGPSETCDGSTPEPPKPPAGPSPGTTTQKFRVSAAQLFAFGHSTLPPEKSGLAGDLQQCIAKHDVVVHVIITGHADCIGSDKSNVFLSEERARTVKSFLIETGKIAPGLIETYGMGAFEANSAALCPAGTRPTTELRERLAPYRRVDVICEYSASIAK